MVARVPLLATLVVILLFFIINLNMVFGNCDLLDLGPFLLK